MSEWDLLKQMVFRGLFLSWKRRASHFGQLSGLEQNTLEPMWFDFYPLVLFAQMDLPQILMCG
jgi:hypothetical protein